MCTHSIPLAMMLFSSFLYDIPPTSYRIGTCLVTPHVVHHAAKRSCRASVTPPPEEGLCVWTDSSRIRDTKACLQHPHHGRRVAKSARNWNEDLLQRLVARDMSFRNFCTKSVRRARRCRNTT
ncbi:hypothetical protein BU25DRAFT_104707 [Macroventuria anomochaeta]|uniref:Uncharacterized protein n=1 Tax=Macroventuria anomochaeta TaxID=301207 RepID=A0ACB6RVS7_9PLEO|nr:uncharacterized protein BU25DRAFT_104707 [Macroventuria anomochaeta]KAF2625843.1 hypothetical protein BU25DRAFT_104707 [Macroventuria anomochaeta]